MTTPYDPPLPGSVCVLGLSRANKTKRRYDAVLTIEDPRTRPGDRLRFTAKPCPAHLVLKFEDCDDASFGYAVATPDHLNRILDWGRTHAEASLLIHCRHGVGRSAAAALAILADRLGPGREEEAMATLLAIQPEATPNLVLIGHADAALGRDGALLAALARSEDADPIKGRTRTARRKLATERPELFTRAPSA
jgi:predicted protein tyrosine phosphatase